MAERTGGLYRIVTVPRLYRAIQNLLGDPRSRDRVKDILFGDIDGCEVLEVGCGPGTWVPFLEAANSYTGIDWNTEHIETARREFGSDTRVFLCGDLADPKVLDASSRFDVVIAMGILHHLDDATAKELLVRVASVLRPGGRFLGAEPVFHTRQNPIAKLLKMLDSGRNIRTEAGYSELLAGSFADAQTQVTTDLMRVPYSHCLFECRAET